MKLLFMPLVCLAAAGLPVQAQETGPAHTALASANESRALTLADATATALQENRDIAVARREVSALEAAVRQASALPNPSIEFVREGHDGATRSSTLQLSVPVELGGKRSARRSAANLDIEMARQELAAVRARVHAEVVNGYYGLYLAGERLRLARASAGTARSASEAAGRRVVAGKISPVEETRAKVAEAAVKVEAMQAQREWTESRTRLAALLGGNRHVAAVAEPSQALPDRVLMDELLVRLDGAPEMAKARLEVERRAALAHVERTRRIPDVSFIVGSKREGPDERRQAVVGLSVPLPLFDRNQGAVLESLRRTDKARDEMAATNGRLRSELAQSHARLIAALDEAALISAEMLPGAQSASDAAAKGFELGKFSFLEVLDAQRTLYQSKTQYVRAVADAHKASAEISQILDMSGARSPEEKQ
jgi:cobalt-zinc-cadmium efflux system outer membrane protein